MKSIIISVCSCCLILMVICLNSINYEQSIQEPLPIWAMSKLTASELADYGMVRQNSATIRKPLTQNQLADLGMAQPINFRKRTYEEVTRLDIVH